jgi:hypothetical protein
MAATKLGIFSFNLKYLDTDYRLVTVARVRTEAIFSLVVFAFKSLQQNISKESSLVVSVYCVQSHRV